MTQQSPSGKWRIPNSKPWITAGDVDATWGWPLSDGIGSQVTAFERELAEFLGRKYVVCVSSGTMALELAHRAAADYYEPFNVTPVSAFGFIATPNAIARAGQPLRFADRSGPCILGELLDDQPIRLVIDACQAFGAKLPPSLADCYSGNWNKPVTCLGGGWVATDDYELSVTISELRDQGRANPRANIAGQCFLAGGTNARMSDMQAALGRSQLRRVGEILERRRTLWDHYEFVLLDNGFLPRPPKRPPESVFLYPIELSNRDEVHAKMQERGIQTRSCADWLLPAHPYYAKKYGYKRGDFPEAERRADRTLLLPLYPEMTLDDVQLVCKTLEECDARA